MRNPPEVLASIVIATTMERKREHSLKRAVESVIDSSLGRARPVLVVNGQRVDEDLFEYWSERQGVQVVRLAKGDYLGARELGRRIVTTRYFGFLDDDDHLLPGALAARVAALEADHDLDGAISNGIVTLGDQSWHSLEAVPPTTEAAVNQLAECNWLPSAAGLFRTATVGEEFFSHEDRHLEWTALALRLCVADAKLRFLTEPGFKIDDTPDSLSKSAAYHAGLASTLGRLVRLHLPKSTRRVWRSKYGRLLHELSTHHLEHGRRWPAFKAHFNSLRHPGGLRYLSYTRHLLLPRRP